MRKDQTMKRKRHTEEQIIAILKEHEASVKTADLCRKHGISEASFYPLQALQMLASETSSPPYLAFQCHVERRTKVSDSLSLGSGRHHFFASSSFSPALSSIASA